MVPADGAGGHMSLGVCEQRTYERTTMNDQESMHD
jgi:hypothetical protein